jgi:hypothetical protein
MRAIGPLMLALALGIPAADARAASGTWSPGGAPAGTASGFEIAAAGRFAAGTDAPPTNFATPVTDGAPVAFLLGRHGSEQPAMSDSARAAMADSVEQSERARQPKLGAARVQAVLRSLTLPGWGQATLGNSGAATVFGLVEAGVWTAYVAFRVQGEMRTSTFEHTARLFAGISLDGRDEEFRRIVGQYSSSDAYNQYVVYRDAANLYLQDPNHPDYDGYRAYIAEHQLQGADRWSWDNGASQLRYQGERKTAQRAQLRANTALAVALINRLVSVLHVARMHGAEEAHPRSWNIEVTPDPGTDPTAFRFGVRTRF